MSELWKVSNMKFVGFGVRVWRFEEASVFSVVNRLIVNRLIVKYTPRSGNVMLRTSASNTFPYFSGGPMKTSYHIQKKVRGKKKKPTAKKKKK